MVWKDIKYVRHGSRLRFAVLLVFLAVFIILMKLFLMSFQYDPIVPFVIMGGIVILVLVAVFVLDLLFYDE